MDSPAPPPPPSPGAEDLFAEFLDRIENGEVVDFDAFCATHPSRRAALQRLHMRWQAMQKAFTALSQEGSAPVAASSPPVDALLAKLGGARAGLSRYALGSEIARGAMGRIVRAHDTDLGRDVAIKIQKGPLGDSRRQRRFLEEAQIAAQLDHPGIVPIHELGLDADGRPYFSMQLVRGRDLGAILALVHGHGARRANGGEDDDGEWTRTRVLHVLLRVCEAMAFAHDKGVVHRDLKPANVMVGRFGEAYVMDWGLARVRGRTDTDADADAELATLRSEIADNDGDSALLTHYGDVLGTPAYMAPEQAAGLNDAAAPAVDVYAIGAILYHLLAGHMPFDGAPADADSVLQRLRAGPPARLGDDVPAELRAICEQAMAREPARRYLGMAALAADLRAFLEVRTVRAYATGRFAELHKWIHRNRTLALACVLLVVALLGGAIAVTSLWVAADDSAARLQVELDRSAFRAARQSLQLENSSDAADALWRAHFAGRMPRATRWALAELAERDPYLVTLPIHADLMPSVFAKKHGVVLVGVGNRVQVRDAETLDLRDELPALPAIASALAILDGGDLVVAGTAQGDMAWFDLRRQTLLRSVRPHAGSIRYVVATAGRGVASGSADGTVLHWLDPTAEPRKVLTLARGVTALAAPDDGSGVVAGDEDGSVRGLALDSRWRIETDLGARITALAFDQAGQTLWVGATDHLLRRLDLSARGGMQSQPTRNGTCRQIARDNDGSLLLGGWWRVDRVAASGATLPPLSLRGVSRFSFEPERRRLLTTGASSGLGLVDVAAADRRRLRSDTSALSADGARLATSIGGKIEVHDVEHNTVIATLPDGTSGWLQLDDDGDTLAIAGTRPAEIRVHDVASGALRFTTEGPTDIPFGDACVFSPDGREMVTRPGGDRVRRVRSSDGHELADYLIAGGRVIRCVWSADGTWLAAIQRNSATVTRIHVASGRIEPIAFPGHPAGTTEETASAVALSADGSRIAIGTWQGTVLVRAADGTITVLPAHAGTVWNVHFAADDDRQLITSGGSQGLAVWDLDANECCYQALQDATVHVQTSRDGKTLACQMPDEVVLIDTTYRMRHVAGNLTYHLERQRGRITLPASREAALRDWATAELARPWPRWGQ